MVRREADGIGREVTERVVQVDVIPHDLERNVRFSHLEHLVSRVVDIAVTPSAKMEAESPRRLPRR